MNERQVQVSVGAVLGISDEGRKLGRFEGNRDGVSDGSLFVGENEGDLVGETLSGHTSRVHSTL